jgi:hypothetical protein
MDRVVHRKIYHRTTNTCTLWNEYILSYFDEVGIKWRQIWTAKQINSETPWTFNEIYHFVLVLNMYCRSLFVPLSFYCIVCPSSIYWFTDSNYPFGIFKLFLIHPPECLWRLFCSICVVFCRSSFVPLSFFTFVIVLAVFRFTSTSA